MILVLSGCAATTVLARGDTRAEARKGPVWLGIEMAPRKDGKGVVVKRVFRASPADSAGLRGGDALLKIADKPASTPAEVTREVRQYRPGDTIDLLFERSGSEQKTRATLAVQPPLEELLRREWVGSPAPAFGSLDAVQGVFPASLQELRGKVVVLDFWASWCEACRYTAPVLSDWYDRLGAQGIAIVSVTSDPVKIAARGAEKFGIRYPVASDRDEDTFAAYRIVSLPALFIIDKKGVIREVEVGYNAARMKQLEKLTLALAAEKD